MLRLLINAGSQVDMVDKRGRTPLYVVVSSLSTGLYKEDLRFQVNKVIFFIKFDLGINVSF